MLCALQLLQVRAASCMSASHGLHSWLLLQVKLPLLQVLLLLLTPRSHAVPVLVAWWLMGVASSSASLPSPLRDDSTACTLVQVRLLLLLKPLLAAVNVWLYTCTRSCCRSCCWSAAAKGWPLNRLSCREAAKALPSW